MRSRSRSATVSTIERPSPFAPVRGSIPNSRANERVRPHDAAGAVDRRDGDRGGVEEAGEAHLGGALPLVDILSRASG